MAVKVSRALGVAAHVSVDIHIDAPEPGDVYLLCSDGLNKMVDDARIREILDAKDASDAASTLVDDANRAGGADNVSVVVIAVNAAPPRETAMAHS